MKYVIVFILFLTACKDNTNNTNQNDFADDKLVHIYEMQDRRDTRGLLPFLKAKKEKHRIAAALAFASIQDTLAIPYLNQMLQIDQDPMPRRAAAVALGQIRHPKALPILRSAFDGELQNSNRPYILEAIGKCGDSATISTFEKTEYQDSSLQVGWVYGVFRLGQKGFYSDILLNRMMDLIRLTEHYDIKEELAAHYLQRYYRKYPNADKSPIQNMIKTKNAHFVSDRLRLILEENAFKEPEISDTEFFYEEAYFDDYEKAGLIRRHKQMTIQFEKYVASTIYNDTIASIVRTTAFEQLLAILPKENRKWEYVLDGLKSTDMALQSLAALEIQKGIKDEENWKILDPKHPKEFLDQLVLIKKELRLPQQAETYIDVCNAIEKLGGSKFDGYQPKFNHPIEWDFVKTIPHNQQVIIKTNKGDITLQLFVNDAPGTVSNFLKLVDSGFYDNRSFHRVVPQFVVQGGCPRGDGWGSLDWTQRSEFSNYQKYSTGTVGIASAGKDTEGVQFFITHCPTPHLDGRYTIFARVTEGMNIVEKMKVGDRIISIKRFMTILDY
ncbi:MAG: hypothetical protein COA58_06240 [Bacteroidetes bacterium]|nr:MAG: hypothetical protein COA58_06240 [Bacteroidota bacterium]